MELLNESLLEAWLRLSTSVINSRVVSELSYNESLVCNALYKAMIVNPGKKLTATDLCSSTKMLKSQMNRTLNQLEKQSIIQKERSSSDKRKIYITLNPKELSGYEKQHQKILLLIDGIIEKLGVSKAEETIELFNQISDIASRLITNM